MLIKYLVTTSFLFLTAYGQWQMPLLINKEQPNNREHDGSVSYRLPNNTRPLHYDIFISSGIHIPDFDFHGVVTMLIEVIETSQMIVINSKMLTINHVHLFDANNQIIQKNVPFSFNARLELLEITPQIQLMQGQRFHLQVNYTGTLRSSAEGYGFFRSSYINEDGREVFLATTQFQATDARHGFPCYDEPQIRTSFIVNIRHHSSYHVVSNMPIDKISTQDPSGYVVTSFERVPSMQTYLVVFTISDFIYDQDATVVPVQKVYTRRASINAGEADLALEVSPPLLKFCEEYFGMNFTFPKMDQVAIPQYAAVAMEHWGACSYGEPFLLYRHRVSTTFDKEYIITLIMHEFVHQWIGNIITPQWWTYLWINEGFATMQMYYLTDLVFPEERYDDTFVTGIIQAVFEIDANPGIRAMSHYVENPSDIIDLFDWIAYSKAGSVLYMFMHAFTDRTWSKGLNYWLNDRYNDYGNAYHLYANLQRAVDQDFIFNPPNVAVMMSTWELQSGFPVLTVIRNGNIFTLTQERFMYDRRLQSNNLWWIPINFVISTNPNFNQTTPFLWMPNVRSMQVQINTPANSWLIFNVQLTSYYRVNYDHAMWQLLINQINAENQGYERIHYRNRAQLIDDAYNLARGNRLDFDIPLELMNYLWQEIDYIPWVPASRTDNYLNRRLSGSHVYPYYQKFIRKIVAKLFNYLGVSWRDEENRTERYGRSIALTMACQAQLPECLKETNRELTEHIFNDKWIGTEYIPSIYCNGLRVGNATLFLSMENRFLRSSDWTERWNIIGGMACTQNDNLLMYYLNLAVTPGLQLAFWERSRILTAPAANGKESLLIMMEYAKFNSALIIEQSEILLTNMLSSIAWFIASDDLYHQYLLLLSELLCQQAISVEMFFHHAASSRDNLDWQLLNMEPIEEFFNRQ